MKKTKYVILMCSLILLSGCVKSNTTMVISKDKSMSLSSEILISDKVNDDKNKLIICDPEAEIVKTIFNMAISRKPSGYYKRLS